MNHNVAPSSTAPASALVQRQRVRVGYPVRQISRNDQAAMSEIPEQLHQRTFETVITKGIGALDVRAAEAHGMDANEYRAHVAAVAGSFQGQADTFVKGRGID